MSDEAFELLADWVLGTATVEERARVAANESATTLALELERTVQLVGSVLPAPRQPWNALTLALAGSKRFAHLIPALADLFELSAPAAKALLETVDSADAWLEGPNAGVWLMPVTAGPKWEGFITTLLKLEPNAHFPMHEHGAEERVLLLEGGYRDDQAGREFWRGELDVRAAATRHSFTALPDLGCLCASVTKLPEDE